MNTLCYIEVDHHSFEFYTVGSNSIAIYREQSNTCSQYGFWLDIFTSEDKMNKYEDIAAHKLAYLEAIKKFNKLKVFL
jgi:hypothetical protein